MLLSLSEGSFTWASDLLLVMSRVIPAYKILYWMFIKSKWISNSSFFLFWGRADTSVHVYFTDGKTKRKSLFVCISCRSVGYERWGCWSWFFRQLMGDGGTVFFFYLSPTRVGLNLSHRPPVPQLRGFRGLRNRSCSFFPTFKLFLSVWLPSASFCRPSGEVWFLRYKIFYLFLQQGPALCFFALWLVLCFLFWGRGPQGITVKPRDVWNGSVWQWIYVVLFSHVTCIRSILLLYVVTISEFLLSLIIFLNILNSLWTADFFPCCYCHENSRRQQTIKNEQTEVSALSSTEPDNILNVAKKIHRGMYLCGLVLTCELWTRSIWFLHGSLVVLKWWTCSDRSVAVLLQNFFPRVISSRKEPETISLKTWLPVGVKCRPAVNPEAFSCWPPDVMTQWFRLFQQRLMKVFAQRGSIKGKFNSFLMYYTLSSYMIVYVI